MTKHVHPLRLGLAATTAALALSATPLFAQDASAPLVTPPPVSTAPAASVPAPTIAASPVPAETATPPAASRGNGFSSSTIPTLDLSGPEPAAAPTPAATGEARARTAPVQRAAAPAAPRVVEATPAPKAPIVVPIAPAPEMAARAPAPVARSSAPATDVAADGDATLPLAIGGLALLGLAGAALSLGRRKRGDHLAEEPAETVSDPVVYQPKPAHAVAADPELLLAGATPARASAWSEADYIGGRGTAVPAAFDTSRFGRHVRAAYQGPTEENPFLSLKRRLKRASFMDQRERMASEAAAGTVERHAEVEVDRAPHGADRTGHVTTRISRQPRPTFRPAFQN